MRIQCYYVELNEECELVFYRRRENGEGVNVSDDIRNQVNDFCDDHYSVKIQLVHGERVPFTVRMEPEQ